MYDLTVNRMGTNEREAPSVTQEWWRFIVHETTKTERREWMNNLRWWQRLLVMTGYLVVILLLLLVLPILWVYDKTR